MPRQRASKELWIRPFRIPHGRLSRVGRPRYGVMVAAINGEGDGYDFGFDRAQRRHRLTKGPSEFREDRVDQPKPKR
jgi:hypothetical protein